MNSLKKYHPLIFIPPLVLLLDQLTKILIVQYFQLGEKLSLIPGYFELVHIRNRGAAFGMLSQWNSGGRQWFFYLISLFALGVLFTIYVKSKPNERRIQIPLAFILGGALRNLLDRITRGSVVDFLSFHWRNEIADFSLFGKHFYFLLSWPAFNVADVAITGGALYLAVIILFFDTRKPQNHLST